MTMVAVASLLVAGLSLALFLKLAFFTDREKRKAASEAATFFDVVHGRIKYADGRNVSEAHVAQGMRTSKKTKSIVPNATWTDEFLKSIST